MKVIYNNIIPFKGYKAINIFGVLFVRKDARTPMTQVDFNHEAIHSKQIWELLGVLYYVWYVVEFLIRWICSGFKWDKAYRSICFENEAYSNQDDLTYLDRRKHYSFFKYF